MNFKKGTLILLGIVLACSAFLKLISVTYVSTIIYLLLPESLLNSFFASHLHSFVIVLSLIELCLGSLLLTRYKKEILQAVLGYLFIMLTVNVYQLYVGVKDCACFGNWIQIPPWITLLKTLVLLFLTGHLINSNEGSDSSIGLSNYQTNREVTIMKTKNKLVALITSLVLVIGLSYAPITANGEKSGDGYPKVCDTTHPNDPIICHGAPTNCFCEVVITPDGPQKTDSD